MDQITVVLFSIILVGIVLFYVLRNIYVSSITKAIKNKKYDNVLMLSGKRMNQFFIGKYSCILFRIRALSCMKNENNFKQEVINVLDGDEITPDKKKEFMEMYFHYFLLKGDGEFAKQILSYIHDFGEPAFTTYNQQAYAVMIEHQSDLIAVIDDQINSKQYNGFALGVLVYLIGLQYLYVDNKEEARTYFYTSLSCFHKNAVYTTFAQKHVDDLSKELGLANPTY